MQFTHMKILRNSVFIQVHYIKTTFVPYGFNVYKVKIHYQYL